MIKMKQVILIFTAIMFLTNTFAVSAWAGPCMNAETLVYPANQTSVNSDIPCHSEIENHQNKQTKKTKHCDGICLCFHASANQIPILNDISISNKLPKQSEQIIIQNDNIVSMEATPPRRPPKLNS